MGNTIATIGDFFGHIIAPIEAGLAYIIFGFHHFFVFLGFKDGSGFAWVLAIVFLTLFCRTLILPLYMRTIKAQSKMQALQPQLQAIQKKYKNRKDQASKEAMSKETMALYKEHGANPMSSCFPLLIQAPILFSLYNTLRYLPCIRTGGDAAPLISEKCPTGAKGAIGPIDSALAGQIENSKLFGVKISDMLSTVTTTQSQIVIWSFIAVMCVVMFLQSFLMVHLNVPKAAEDSSAMKTQKLMPFLFPVIYIFMGSSFPFGVLIYWVISNLYMFTQQMWVLYNKPAFGSKAFDAKTKREAKKNVAKGLKPDGSDPNEIVVVEKKQQRQQPMGKSRAKKATKKTGKSVVTSTKALQEGDVVIINGERRKVKSVRKVK
jgi:YidC/Oxa1 family membrane protein insertase